MLFYSLPATKMNMIELQQEVAMISMTTGLEITASHHCGGETL